MPLRDILSGPAVVSCIGTLTGAVAYIYWTRGTCTCRPGSTGASTGVSTGASTDAAGNTPRAGAKGTTQSIPTIEQREEKYFKEISNRAALTDTELGRVKDVINNHTDAHCEVNEARSLEELLHMLIRTGVVQNREYKIILNVLDKAKLSIDMDDIEEYVNILLKDKSDIDAGRIPTDFDPTQRKLDVLILSADDDRSMVQTFKSHLSADIGIRNLSVLTYEEQFHGCTFGDAEDSVFTCARYVFVYVTQAFSKDYQTQYGACIALIAGLKDQKKSKRIIPVYTTQDRIDIALLRPITGVNYWDWQGPDDNLKSSYVSSVKRLIQNGRENVV